jgi:UDP-N-acetylmuramyl pentapeptide phosphotransferase/UDP-N-acetylglucosamine-1-phosphate transferase
MLSLIISFFSSFLASLLIVRLRKLHARFSLDINLDGPQKFHKIPVPRIGGISIVVGIFVATSYKNLDTGSLNTLSNYLLLSATPTFLIGFMEDVTKTISVKIRLIFTSFGAAIFIYLLQSEITNIDLKYLNIIFNIPFFSTLFTIFAITGLSNAYNIIDGFNGLASMTGLIALVAIAYIGFITEDSLITFSSLIMIGAIAGFFIWNYPNGKIFLGDGGAYLIGFWIACLSILIVTRQNSISPWFAFLINGYPITETVFTIYRRCIHQKRSAHKPDGIHLHTLIHQSRR